MMALTEDRRPNGFTLFELLIALTVLGFLFAGLAQGVHFGLLAWATEAHLTGGNDDFNTLDNTLRHLIEVADPGDDLDSAPFAANRDRLDCVTVLPNAYGGVLGRRIRATLLVDADHDAALAAICACDATAGPTRADRDRIAARRIAHRAGLLAAGRRLGQRVAVT
jgi:prepilin-type N-terminal cleavage/methylation domain-containing protein